MKKIDEKNRIDLVVSLIQTNFSKNDWNRVSARQIINRLLVLFQKPTTILLYQKLPHTGSTYWKLIYHSHHDYAYQDEFEKTILRKSPDNPPMRHREIIGLNQGKRAIYYQLSDDPAESKFPKHPIEISGDGDGLGYGYILTTVEGAPNNRELKLLKKRSDEYTLLEKLWKSLLSNPYSKSIGIEQRLIHTFEKAFYKEDGLPYPNIPKLEEKNPSINKDETQQFRSFLDQQCKIITDDLFNTIYEHISFDPTITNRGKLPVNIFFSHRYYDQAKYRDRSNSPNSSKINTYPYSLRFVLPRKQEADLLKTLRIIKNNNKSIGTRDYYPDEWHYPYKEWDGFSNTVSFRQYFHPTGRNWFWNTIRKRGGIKEFLQIIQKPFGKHTRGLPDPPLASGFLHLRPNIYSRGGLERIADSMTGNDELNIESPDVQRMVIMYYIFCAAAPVTENKEISKNRDYMGMFIVPLRTGGKTYMTIGSIIPMLNNGLSIENNEEYFLRNYYLYADISQKAERILRRKSRSLYLFQIRKIFTYEITRPFIQLVRSEESIPVPIDQIAKEVNKKYDWLCRAWPYDKIQVEFLEGAPDTDNPCHIQIYDISKYHLKFTITPNSYYYHLNYRPMDKGDLGKNWVSKDRVNRAFVKALEDVKIPSESEVTITA